MKLVFRTRDEGEAYSIVSMLESNGIPAFTSNEHTNSLRRYSMAGIGVFLHINTQKSEAVKLLNNPSYQVQNKVNVLKFYEQLESADSKSATNEALLNFLVKGLVSLLLISFIVLYVLQKT